MIVWMGHSMNHSRDKKLQFAGRVFSELFGGFSLDWWAPRHNMHHIFTNSDLYPDDIGDDFSLYFFMHLKWRYSSLKTTVKRKKILDITCIVFNYFLIFYCYQNFVYFIVG